MVRRRMGVSDLVSGGKAVVVAVTLVRPCCHVTRVGVTVTAASDQPHYNTVTALLHTAGMYRWSRQSLFQIL